MSYLSANGLKVLRYGVLAETENNACSTMLLLFRNG